MGEMANKLATKAWLKHAGLETIALWQAGKINDKTHRSNDLALAITKQVACIIGTKELLTNIRRRCMICGQKLHWPDPTFKKVGQDHAGQIMMKADVRRRSGRHNDGRVTTWIMHIVY